MTAATTARSTAKMRWKKTGLTWVVAVSTVKTIEARRTRSQKTLTTRRLAWFSATKLEARVLLKKGTKPQQCAMRRRSQKKTRFQKTA